MTFEEFRRQIIDYIGFEPVDPANYAYNRNHSKEEDAMLPWAPGAKKSNTIMCYYDENDRLLYKVYIGGLSYYFGMNPYSPFVHLPAVDKYTITCGDFEYTVKRFPSNCSVPTIEYVVYKTHHNDSGNLVAIKQEFSWQIEE